MLHVYLPYLIISTLFIDKGMLYVANGPELFLINLTSGATTRYSYMKYCGSLNCVPLCVGRINGTIVIGTSGSLISFSQGKFKVLLPYPVTSCNGSFSVMEIYRDAKNYVIYGELLDTKLNPLYKGCGVYSSIGTYAMSLVCNSTFHVRWGNKTLDVDAPALLSGTRREFLVLVLDSYGKYYVVKNGNVIDEGTIGVLNPYKLVYLSYYNGRFFIVWNSKLYMWKDGKLYASNLNVIAAIAYKDSLIVTKVTEKGLAISSIPLNEVVWKVVPKRFVQIP